MPYWTGHLINLGFPIRMAFLHAFMPLISQSQGEKRRKFSVSKKKKAKLQCCLLLLKVKGKIMKDVFSNV